MFKRAEGLHYYKLFGELHAAMQVDWYMEIGCRRGQSFKDVRSKTIAVDPVFKIEENVINSKAQLHFFQQPSDTFFEEGFLDAMGIRLDMSFLDGMHLYEYLLRDFINTEKRTRRDGVIFMHDCCPYDHEMTTRDLDNLPKGAWTGDVWKVLPILKKYRPDLKIDVFDCRPSGIVMVSNLKPGDNRLIAAYDEIIKDWTDVTMRDYGPGRFYEEFPYRPAHSLKHGRFAELRHLALPET